MTLPKLTNPKDAIGSTKLPLNLIPDTPLVHMALAFLEGALKYGTANWRIAGVRASIYIAAAERHMKKWKNGEREDPRTRIHHLGSAMACLAILLDAELANKLNDDRPPSVDLARLIDDSEKLVAHLQELFKDHDPRHYTIADTEHPVSPLTEEGAAFNARDQQLAMGAAAERAPWPGEGIPPSGGYRDALPDPADWRVEHSPADFGFEPLSPAEERELDFLERQQAQLADYPDDQRNENAT